MLIRRLVFVALLVCGCKRQAPPAATPSTAAPAHEAPAWPPEGGEVTAPPPGVQEVMRRMVNALDGGDGAAVKAYFMNALQVGVLDCGPFDLGARVTAARDATVARAAELKGKTTFKGFGEGRFVDVKRDAALGPCKAKVDVSMFRASTSWDLGGTAETHDTLLLGVQDAWFVLQL